MAGPDGIGWLLLKMITNTTLGKVVIQDVAVWASTEKRAKVPKGYGDGHGPEARERPHQGEGVEADRTGK